MKKNIAQNVRKSLSTQNDDSEKIALNVRKSTSWKTVRRVRIAQEPDEDQEIENNFIKRELVKVAKKYILENCDKTEDKRKIIFLRNKKNL